MELRDDGTKVQEVDVVLSCNGRLHLIDCKLHDGKKRTRRVLMNNGGYQPMPLSSQSRAAFATRRPLGDGWRPRSRSCAPRWMCVMRSAAGVPKYRIDAIDKVDLVKVPLQTKFEQLSSPLHHGHSGSDLI
ncbi:hypothetical protein [Nocardioides sp. KR10-350]|uniref:hypothetical protein n=1 Tax=Nocardioides cheoyonin TaxID=3156615 RepID=UPI0032B5EF89